MNSRWRGVGHIVLAAFCGATTACGSTQSNGISTIDRGADAAAGGTGTSSGGATAASGGSAGGLISSGGAGGGTPNTVASEHGACVEYLRAECNRKSECDGFPVVDEPCPTATATCPDFLFSTGSTRTVESVLACAETWKTFSCDEVHREHFPACAAPGTRPPGSSCVYGAECDSGLCLKGTPPPAHPDCGICTTAAAPGDACSYGTGPLCSDGYECGPGNTCVALPPFGLAPGSPCERYGQCGQKTVCLGDPNNPSLGGTCQPLRALGQACAAGQGCEGEAYCVDADRKCEAPPKPGEPCGLASGATSATACTKNAFCDEGAVGGPRCVARFGPGTPCHGQPGETTTDRCATGLWCVCSDGTCVNATCLANVGEGEACGAPNTRCVPGTECKNGSCVSASQGTFATACGQ